MKNNDIRIKETNANLLNLFSATPFMSINNFISLSIFRTIFVNNHLIFY